MFDNTNTCLYNKRKEDNKRAERKITRRIENAGGNKI